ncbi:MAG: 50S ribosomal protein L4 [Chloroflexi bacterium]|nr:50S ribosomal protein L4 [Chloroflexota bacterium]
MQLKVLNKAGDEVDTIEVEDAVFGIKPNMAVMHQVVIAHQANRRAGTHSTKGRGEVEGSTKKIRSQKGTGRSRQGSIRAPHHTGGGIAFGPKPHKYTQSIPKMLRRLAIRSALSAKVADSELVVIDDLAPATPKTKEMVAMLAALGGARSPLIVTATPNRTVFMAARNIEGAKVVPASHINTEDIIKHHRIVMTVGAVRQAEALWGGERVSRRLAPIPTPAEV